MKIFKEMNFLLVIVCIFMLFSLSAIAKANDSVVICVKSIEKASVKFNKIKGFTSEQYSNVTKRCQRNPAIYLSEVRWYEERVKYLPKNKNECVQGFVGYFYSKYQENGMEFYTDEAEKKM